MALGNPTKLAIARAGRPGTPNKIAEGFIFLASPESWWIKGQNFTIDGDISAMTMTDAFELTDVCN